MSMVSVSTESATQFALMLSAGMPAEDAIGYFIPPDTETSPGVIKDWLDSYLRSPLTQKAILTLQGKPWQGMSIDEKMRFALDKNYTEAAYFLYSHNYCDLSGHERQKADTCRQILETKLAGMAGKMGALESFYADILGGKVKLPPSQLSNRSASGAGGAAVAESLKSTPGLVLREPRVGHS